LPNQRSATTRGKNVLSKARGKDGKTIGEKETRRGRKISVRTEKSELKVGSLGNMGKGGSKPAIRASALRRRGQARGRGWKRAMGKTGNKRKKYQSGHLLQNQRGKQGGA